MSLHEDEFPDESGLETVRTVGEIMAEYMDDVKKGSPETKANKQEYQRGFAAGFSDACDGMLILIEKGATYRTAAELANAFESLLDDWRRNKLLATPIFSVMVSQHYKNAENSSTEQA